MATDRLSDEQVAEIRRRHCAGEATQKALAVEYGISQPHVSRITRCEVRTSARDWALRYELKPEWLLTEQWKIAPAWFDYEVSTLGRVRRRTSGVGARAGCVLRPRTRKGGYLSVALYRNGKRRDVLLHHLVLETFVGPRPPDREGCHKNSTPADCRLSNLRWGTRESNIEDRNNARQTCDDGHRLGEWMANGPGKRVRRCKECIRIRNGAVRRYKPRVKK